jgi:hypothetical protein
MSQNPTLIPSPAPNTPGDTVPAGSEHEQQVLQAIRGTTFGTIEVTIHQSRIVQITRSEKIRF